MENLIDIIIELLAVLLALGITWLVAKAKTYINAKIKETEHVWLAELVNEFCAAAEQELKADDPTGEKRKERVYELLAEAGVEVSGIVDALIEAAVHKIGKGA